jgi:ABC-type multidrug transport system ATPase subunit
MTKPLIKLENVQKSYGKNRVLNGGTLEVNAGEFACIVGENGSGKSTLLKIAIGLLKADKGFVFCTENTGYCPQELLLYEYLNIEEHFRLFGLAYNLEIEFIMNRSEQLMEIFGFRNYRKFKVHQLSGGTRQKLNLSLALLHDPKLLLLDEPYAGFDKETYHCFLNYTKEAIRDNRAIVMVSHLIHDREHFSMMYNLRNGMIDAETL